MKHKRIAIALGVTLFFAVIAVGVFVPNVGSIAKVALSSVVWASSKGPPLAKLAAGGILIIELKEVKQRSEKHYIEIEVDE
ncbi:MAG: hypothetical protein F4114_12090 [Rhodospirillaceae bacterium]|nr:hypothetical protein [Rhodospirillaceae bacterium]MYB11891.1 hypothetical protein [Rhodospirillaceae bacterium]MYI49808.1 hypothetical protein [Rhodospirillaceae bacterium]